MLILNDKQVSELETLINELPTKYGVPLFGLFRKFGKENEEASKQPVSETVTDGKAGS